MIFLSPMHYSCIVIYLYIYICMYMHEIMHWAKEYHIYIYFNFVRLRYQTVGWCLLPYYIPSIIWYDFQNVKFLYNMQCVNDISKNSQKMQWSMRIGTFLETRKISVEVLEEHFACRLQSAWHSFK